MCGGFTCSKNTLLGLNIVYVLVAFLLIGTATYGKSAAYITSLPVLGGIVACGVFLLFVAVFGLLATLKHHQVMLFLYMIILFAIFIIQFSVACAALAVDEKQEGIALNGTWYRLDQTARLDVEKNLGCCGFYSTGEILTKDDCQQVEACKSNDGDLPACPPCYKVIEPGIGKAFSASGGLGLFFALTEIIGTVLAYRYRNLANPYTQSSAGAQLFS